MGFQVLSLPTFFAPAKKVGRRPGRIPGGLSRSEKPPSAKRHNKNKPRSDNKKNMTTPPKDPFRYFRIEARDLHEQLGRGVLALERSPADAQGVPRLLRLAHTLKGAARVVRQREIADRAHAIEEALAPWRDAAAPLPREPIDAVLALVDDIGGRIAQLAAPQGTGATAATAADAGEARPAEGPAAPALPQADAARHAPRAEAAEIDALLQGLAQTHAQLGTLRGGLGPAQRARQLADRLADLLAVPRRAAPGPERGTSPAALALLEELRRLLGGLEGTLALSADHVDRELRQVRDAAEQLRLVPASALFTPLELTVRDAARLQGRQARFQGRGGAVRLDAGVLGSVQGALVQLVRNAVAHGIEPAAHRLAAGKPAAGVVTLDVQRQGRRVVFTCSDDGAGVDLDAVRQAAQRRGGPLPPRQAVPASHDTPGAPGAGDQALLQLLLRGGLSTAGTVTELAGRGIGLDVVRDTVERLGGEVLLHTEAGRGTAVQLVVPLTIASVDVLQVEAAGTVWALPLEAVLCTLRHEPHALARTAQGDSLVHDGQALPFVTLARALGRAGAAPARAAARTGTAVILRGDDGGQGANSPGRAPGRSQAGPHPLGGSIDVPIGRGANSQGRAPGRSQAGPHPLGGSTDVPIGRGAAGLAAIGVDRLLGTAAVVMQPLPELAPADPVVAGASLDAQGQPQLVLDAPALVQLARRAGAPPAPAEAPRAPVLVVDDSLTTRMLEQSILESAGYTVHAAVSAEDGLERAQRQRYALFLVDVEMPGMDGFTFVERTRADPVLRNVPAILVTSRSSPEDRRRGQEVGAQGYIVKSEFAQAEFLQRVHELTQ
jgi:two-component system chemotaxis sensor kinase CheA